MKSRTNNIKSSDCGVLATTVPVQKLNAIKSIPNVEDAWEVMQRAFMEFRGNMANRSTKAAIRQHLEGCQYREEIRTTVMKYKIKIEVLVTATKQEPTSIHTCRTSKVLSQKCPG